VLDSRCLLCVSYKTIHSKMLKFLASMHEKWPRTGYSCGQYNMLCFILDTPHIKRYFHDCDKSYKRFFHKGNIKATSTSMARKKVITVADDKIFVEQRPEGDYAVRRPNSDRASAVTPTQEQAIDRAGEIAPNARILVERVRNTSVGGRDQWRKP